MHTVKMFQMQLVSQQLLPFHKKKFNTEEKLYSWAKA